MKILKGAGYFTVLSSIDELKAQLLNIERAGRTCYQSERDEVTLDTAKKFCRMLLKRGHHSVIEHSNMIVRFSNVSRGFTHEQVRHRLTSISQESTRYVDYAKQGKGPDLDDFELKCVVPPHHNEYDPIILGDGSVTTMYGMFNKIEDFYRSLRKAGLAPEDARQVLPIGIKSQIVISANFREWRHIFSLRTAKTAHWEIRSVMCSLLRYIKPRLPPIFDDFVESGFCHRGILCFTQEEL